MTLLTITTLDSDPLVTEFIPLHEYRSSTPASFSLEESPVLHYSVDALKLESPQLYRLSLPKPTSTSSSFSISDFRTNCENGLPVNVKIASS